MFLKLRQKILHINTKKYHQYKQHVSNDNDDYQRVNNKTKKKQVVIFSIVTSGLGICSIVNSTFGKIFDNCVLED